MKKQWVPVKESVTVSEAYQRLQDEGYLIVGRREVPVFEERDGEPVPVKQQIEFCITMPKDER
ncbi:NETI motif-containing protein [Chryseomicrobium palamuruense]|uniref:NETI motif-containing protein n=1 Tax=Chryseomicrobium palamuruense TaxID=682973 RepID=A0ABV8UWQ7_9BACL